MKLFNWLDHYAACCWSYLQATALAKALNRKHILRSERGSLSRNLVTANTTRREFRDTILDHRAAVPKPVVFGTQNARGVLPLSPCEERAGREPERGETEEKHLLSPALSSFFEEERERKRGCALKANLLPNTTVYAEHNCSQSRAPQNRRGLRRF